MVRWKPGHKDSTRTRILETAGRLFRERGYAGIGVSDLMKSAGLTAGGFYSHFESKEALLSAVLMDGFAHTEHALFAGLEGVEGAAFVRELTRRYLSREHRDHPEHGCVLPALAADVARHGDAPRHDLAGYLLELASRMQTKVPRSARSGLSGKELALALTALCVGGIVLARAVDDAALSDAILRACRRFADAELEV
ncbi:TetR/AcrR family transcriptional regulator [Sandaracinus amylolyticus]|uniref:TetR/AcrR family transcriptional regulator n=1 Tax=Sandaracinus amylolyticus TaxID=927083 RepID=UPI001F1EB2E6|nr:TetR/AcrR family transcriptional regulator [Sandaracinus amylolyticus]UJR78236.1 HTH-type transcriptional repressor NemR [Sandaracinus amylolyticus]